MFGWFERFLFAPEGGGWAYTYVQKPDGISLLSLACLVPPLLWLWRRTEPQIQVRPWRVLAQWMAAALVVQAISLLIAPYSLTSKLESINANGFYAVSTQYDAAHFLRQFNEISATLPMHVRANLPGKVLLFHLLRTISERPTILAGLIVSLSTLGGLLVYVVALQWFRNPRTAIVAAIFYLLLPARIFFLPLLNTISPLFMLIPLALAGAWTRTGAPIYAMLLGPAIYALAIFDPLPLIAGLCGVAALVTQHDRPVPAPQWLWFALTVLIGCLAAYAVVAGLFHFDIVSAYGFTIHDATSFNVAQHRPYWFWVGHNLKDFAIAMGIGQACILLFRAPHWLRDQTHWIGISIVACLVLVDMLGINRGEVARLWIFLGVLFQLLAAHASDTDRRIVGVIIALSATQTILCMRSIAWVVP